MKKIRMPKVIKKTKCWIVDHKSLRAERVVMEERDDTSKKYKRLRSKPVKTKKKTPMGSDLYPYYPTLGSGDRSRWGDGPTYKTREEAEREEQRVVKEKLKEPRREKSIRMRTVRERYDGEIESLKGRLK